MYRCNNRLGKLSNPKSRAGILSKYLFFGWLHPFLRLGFTKVLDIGDIYRLLPEDGAERLRFKLYRKWEKQLEKTSRQTKPSLLKAIWAVFGFEFMLQGLLAFTGECVLRLVHPLCLRLLIQYFQEDSAMSVWPAYAYATGVVFSSVLYMFTSSPLVFGGQHTGMRIRVAVCSLIYKKSLLLSQKALCQTTVGQMVNLLSNDAVRFHTSVPYLHYLWVGPLQVLISMAILLHFIGPSCFAGFFVLVLFVFFQGWMAGVFSRLRMLLASRTDRRLRTMKEIITGIRVIKMYTWENPLTKLIKNCRKKEVDVIRRVLFARSLVFSFSTISIRVIIFSTLFAYVITGNSLTSQEVFMTMAMFNNIDEAITEFFTQAVRLSAECLVTIKRIENFLMLDEMVESRGAHEYAKSDEDEADSTDTENVPLLDETVHSKIGYQRPESNHCGLDLIGVSGKWSAAVEQEDITLKDISFSVKPGQIVAVIGDVGSGKSSLLNGIIGELPIEKGNISVRGKIAYAPQEAWVFSGTVRQNVLCGSVYDVNRYQNVIRACALEKDFSLLLHGDRTVVGDNGTSLSGGQKARLNLARALYTDADIYLLDDPLSAVDAHVGRHLFDKAINGFLSGKIRILVTHQLQYLKRVDQIIVLKEGHVDAIGRYDELLSYCVEFQKTVAGKGFDQKNKTETFLSEKAETSLCKPDEISTTEEELKPACSEESRCTGSVKIGIYWQYIRAGASCMSLLLFATTSLIGQGMFQGTDYWLTLWTNSEELRYLRNLTETNQTRSSLCNSSVTECVLMNEEPVNGTITLDWTKEIDTTTGIYVFSILIGGSIVFGIIRTIHFFVICLLASVKLHNKMVKSVIRTQLAFFDRNPMGRILNRFSKDIASMDELIPPTIYKTFNITILNLGTIVIVGVVNLWLILPLVFLLIIFLIFRRFYLESARDVQRLEATSQSPLLTHVASTMNGLTTLRAHRLQPFFQRTFDDLQDVHTSVWYMKLCLTYWFGFWLYSMCIAYITCVTYICVYLRDNINGSEIGLIISSMVNFASRFRLGVQKSTELENHMVSVERIIEYIQLRPERALTSQAEKKLSNSRPLNGEIQFDCMSIHYTNKDQPVLKNITCSIKAGEKIGIVGRTGAGKSSLITALFRLTEPEGRVLIDGIDTKSIGLHELRSRISIIPQDPFLFSGTMRDNLDPLNEHQEKTLWSVLETANLKKTVSKWMVGLDSVMAEGGSNLSVGERQLVSLSRAILKQNRILVLDEATANIDQKTDSLIQLTIRERFKDCTVLTIAHRLDTIMNSDRVMLLDAGYLKEFDRPEVLLNNPENLFYGLVQQAGCSETAS